MHAGGAVSIASENGVDKTVSLTPIVVALAPSVLLVSLGWALRRRWVVAGDFWRQLGDLAYTVFLPVLFFHSLATADLTGTPVTTIAVVLLVSSVGAAALVLPTRRLPRLDGPAFTSVFQGAVRFNNYVGLAVSTVLFGREGLELAVLANAVLVPTVNVTSTIVLARFGHRRLRPLAVARAVATNPLVVGSVLGLVANLVAATAFGEAAGRIDVVGAVNGILGDLFELLGGAALPVGLLCVGAGLVLDSRHWKDTAIPVAAASAFRFGVVPGLTLAMCSIVGLSGEAAIVAVLFQALPTASSAYLLARRHGGDADLMATIIALQTIAAVVFLPVWISIAAAVF